MVSTCLYVSNYQLQADQEKMNWFRIRIRPEILNKLTIKISSNPYTKLTNHSEVVSLF